MRQPTKGRVLQERVWRFIEVLLTQAENSSNFEIKWETDKDTGRPNFVVKTRRRFLESLAQLKKHELTEVIKSLENLQIWDDRRLKRGQGSEIGSFALKLWSTDAQRNREEFDRVWDSSRTAKSKALEATYKKSKDHDEAAQPEIDWRDVCRTKLEKQKQLTTNRLMRADEMLFDINQICVDLVLVERKKPDKRNGDDNPKQSQSYKPEYEETEKLEYKDFLTKVLKSEPSKNVAIIGEPGAGKTTILQRIAFWILENTNSLPIWIPLGILPTAAPRLKDYLLHHWLEDAIVSVTPKIKTEFEELLTAGRVWLLLDGVDEMVANFGNSLSFINNWIPGWCQHLSVVLTCRLNVWEANPYALNNFKTYRTLEFSPEKVNEFIQTCFQNRRGAPTCAHELGIQLQQALNEPGKERIKDLVKNPLRLTLLCSTWHLREGKLPDTKAELYQQFVEEVYRWKKDEFPTTPEEREQLNAKLKELAREAIDKEENRFCLRHKFVEGILGDREGSMFKLALNIGWLNQVGVDAKNPNPNQPVYAFFHPTFQEYFAALAIDDWDFFLPRAHDNDNPKPVSERYRIFEPQWKEVILLWLGRPHEEVAKEQKEAFIQKLVTFQDGCGNFYWYRALFLAAAGFAELRDCRWAHKIVTLLAKWSSWNFHPINQEARKALLETKNNIKGTAIIYFIDIILASENESISLEAAYTLNLIFPGNTFTTKIFVELLYQTKNDWIKEEIFYFLEETGKGNETVVSFLLNLIHKDDDKFKFKAMGCLGFRQVGKDSEEAIAALVQLIQTAGNYEIRQEAALNLGFIGQGNETAISTLINIAQTTEDEDTRELAVFSLGGIGKDNHIVISTLVRMVTRVENENTRLQVAYSLGKIDPGNETAIATLIQLIQTAQDEEIRETAALFLGYIDSGNEVVISYFIKIIKTTKDESVWRRMALNISEISEGSQTEITVLTQLIKKVKTESTILQVAEALGRIDPGNKIAVAKLIQTIRESKDETIIISAVCTLAYIDSGNVTAIPTLVKLIENTKSEDTRIEAIRSLEDIGAKNQMAIITLIDLIKKTENEYTCWQAVQSLEKITSDYIGIILSLHECFDEDAYQQNKKRFVYLFQLIWNCAQNLPYPAFYQAWHQPEEVDDATTPNRQIFNPFDLPQRLQTAITNDPQLSQIIHLICIDSSQCIEPDNPTEIYDQMLDQNCPECDSVPEKMPALKLYWNSLKRNSNKRPFLVFYASSTHPYNQAFLTALSKFGREICVITEQPIDHIPLKYFTPSQSIKDILEWIRTN